MLYVDDPSTVEVLEKLGLGGVKPLAVGTTAVVYDRGNSVLRLTMDFSSHHFLINASKLDNLATPKVIADQGVVGRYTGDEDDEDFYLAEIEKLCPLTVYPALFEEVRGWVHFLDNNHPEGAQFYGDESVEAFANLLPEWVTRFSPPQSMVETFQYLASSSLSMFDLSEDNFMVRASTEEIIVTDPLHD